MAATTERVNLRDFIVQNAEVLHVLNEAGVKTIQTALDCITINDLNDSMSYITSKTERKDRIADQIGVSRRTVDSALSIINKQISIKKSDS